AMLAVALALASSVVWGASDFLGGIATRRLTLAPVLVVSQLAGLVLLGVATGLAAFYAALATGTISIVSPVSACGAIVPVGLALARGERPGALAPAGCAIALAGAAALGIGASSTSSPTPCATATRSPPSSAAAPPRSACCSWACSPPAARCACRRAGSPPSP